MSFAPVGPTLGQLELVGSADVEVVGSWPGPVQLFNSGYSLFDPALYRYTCPDGQVFVVDKTAGLKSLTDRAGNVLDDDAGRDHVVASAGAGLDARDRLRARRPGADHADHGPAGPEPRLRLRRERRSRVRDRPRGEHATSFGYLDDPAHHLETIDDPLGRTPIRNDYFADGRLKSHTDAFGNTIEYQHDVLGRQEIVTDRTGAQRVLEYDERGNVLRETDPLGRVVVRTFDARNNRLSGDGALRPREPAGSRSRRRATAYDAQDNLLSHHRRRSATPRATPTTATRQVLTTQGRRRTTPRRTATTRRGTCCPRQDALGNVTSYSYDTRGNVLTQTVTVNGTPQVTRYEYDGYGRLKKETDATGHATSYTYDSSGNRLTQTTTRTAYTCTASAPPVCSASGTETLTTTLRVRQRTAA